MRNTSKLQALQKLNQETNNLILKWQKEESILQDEYMRVEKDTLDWFLSELRELSKFGSGGYTNTVINYYWSKDDAKLIHYSTDATMGDFCIKANPRGYSKQVLLYDSKTNIWDWNPDKTRKFFATHADSILCDIQKCIESNLEKKILQKQEEMISQSSKLHRDIELAFNSRNVYKNIMGGARS